MPGGSLANTTHLPATDRAAWLTLSLAIASLDPRAVEAQTFPADIAGFAIGGTPESVAEACAEGFFHEEDKFVCRRLFDELDFEADVIIGFSVAGRIESVSFVTPRLGDASEVFVLYRALFQQYVAEYGTPDFHQDSRALVWHLNRYGWISLRMALQDRLHGNLILEFLWRT